MAARKCWAAAPHHLHRGTSQPDDGLDWVEISEELYGEIRSSLLDHDDPRIIGVEGGVAELASPPPPPEEPEPEPVDLVAYAALKRWECEVGGTIWNDWPVHTDRESQSKFVAERVAVEAGERQDPDGWKFADGEFRMISNADFVMLSNAVRDHVRQCFALEAQVLAAIEAEQISTTEEIDAAFAPD